ncbi:MAG: hypothetical protein K2K64_10190 [Muribaculaceae bacterium]|nr:hypothetical protein [Muribaculaceae bacterium]
MKKTLFRILVVILLPFFLESCKKEKEAPSEEAQVLLSVDGEDLTLSQVIDRIPVGIDPADSLALFEDIIDTWVSERVLTPLAESKLSNLEEIERKVSAYRSRLIVTEYLRQMRRSKSVKVSADSIRRFYDLHRGEMLTERPLIKGIYLKVASSSPQLEEIRRLIASGSEGSVDRLESHYGGEALQYDYFDNVWVDWQTIADMIPYRFYDPDAFLQATRDFETTYNGSTYLLHVSEYLPTGSEQPFEFAKERIEAMMEQTKVSSYEEALVSSLVEKAIKDGRLVRHGYDPVKHRMLNNGTSKRKQEEKNE